AGALDAIDVCLHELCSRFRGVLLAGEDREGLAQRDVLLIETLHAANRRAKVEAASNRIGERDAVGSALRAALVLRKALVAVTERALEQRAVAQDRVHGGGAQECLRALVQARTRKSGGGGARARSGVERTRARVAQV